MQTHRSPPKYTKLSSMGGSTKNSTVPTTSAAVSAQRENADSSSPTSRLSLTGSTLSLNSSSSKSRLIDSSTENVNVKKPLYYQHSHSHSHHQHNYHYQGSNNNGSTRSQSTTSSGKRGRKNNWGTRERTGMSFLIVIVFFAIFGLIILTELFMIDERSHSAMVMLRHGGNYGGRLGDSMPDYDNVKDDYDLLDEKFLGDNKLGYVQFRDNKLQIQNAGDNDDAGRLAGVLLNSGSISGYGVGAGMGVGAGGGNGGINIPQIPWGKVLPTKIEETLPPYPIGIAPTSGSWQVVNGTRFKFFVFSAYYDRRDGAKLVRVIGATKTRGPERVWCRFWYMNRNISSGNDRQRGRYTSVTVMSRVKIIRENWNLKYSACFIMCPVRANELEAPQYVSIVSRLRAPPGNLLTLRNTDFDPDFQIAQGNQSSRNFNSTAMPISPVPPPTGDQIADKIAVCVKPFHFNYDQALYLVEFLEFYALLGISHFTFYNHTTGPHADCVLQHYLDGNIPDKLTAYDEDVISNAKASSATVLKNVTSGKQSQPRTQSSTSTASNSNRHISSHYVKPTINILPWNLRMRSQKEIRTEGLFAALNDCLYRNMYRYKYLALVDLDEFIVPRHNDTLYDLISSLNQRFPNRNIGAYSFQNAFFYLQFPDDALVYQNTVNGFDARMRAALVTQRKTKRRYKLHPQKQRSKYVCKPEFVVEAGNHFVWEFSPGKGSLNVAPTEAILQHYRVCEFGGNDCIKAPSVVDRTATKYVNRLVQRVETVYRYLKDRCNLPELPVLPKNSPKLFTHNEENANNQQTQRQPLASATRPGHPQNNEQPNNKLKSSTVATTKNINLKAVNAVDTTKVNMTITSMAKMNRTTNKIQENTTKINIQDAPSNKSERTPVMNNQKFQHKLIVFEQNANGEPRARIVYN